MKTLKRITGLVLTGTMLVSSFAVSASATMNEYDPGSVASTDDTTSTSETGSIILKNPDGSNVSINGASYTAYRIFDLVMNDDHTAYAYTIADGFADVFLSDEFAAEYPDSGITAASADELKTSEVVTFVSGLTSNSVEIDSFAKLVYAYAAENADVSKVTASGTEDETVVFENIPLGYYLILGNATADDGGNVITACSLDTTSWDSEADEYVVEVDLKVGAPTLGKVIVEGDETTDAVSKNIGDTVTFRITSEVPNVTGYVSYEFIVTDTMSEGLTFNDHVTIMFNNVEIEASTGEGDDAVTNYTVSENDGVITIDFEDFYSLVGARNENYAAGTDIVIEYTAVLNEDAVIGTAGNPNSAKLTYSNNPQTDSTADTTDDVVKVYTYELDVYKYAEGKKANALKGAEFTVAKGTDLVEFVLEDGKYRVATADDADADKITTVVSDENGKIKIEGLAEGTYTLTETKAPDGYNLLESPVNVTISATYSEGSATIADADTDNHTLIKDAESDATLGILTEISNSTGNELPSTGGIGTKLIYIAGGLLIAVAVVSVSVRKIAKKRI